MVFRERSNEGTLGYDTVFQVANSITAWNTKRWEYFDSKIQLRVGDQMKHLDELR